MADSPNKVAQRLAKGVIFSSLRESELEFLAKRAVVHRYSTGELVFGEGEPCIGLYVAESGHVRILKSSSSGWEQVLSIDGAGASIAELAELPVFDGAAYPASAGGIEDATLLFVKRFGTQSAAELKQKPTGRKRAGIVPISPCPREQGPSEKEGDRNIEVDSEERD